MIGSLIYFGLYPLSQLFIRLSESWSRHHLVIINYKAVCGDGARSCTRLNDQQTALLDQCEPRPEASETSSHTVQKRREVEELKENRSLLDVSALEKKTEMEEDKETNRLEDLLDLNPKSVIQREEVSISVRAKIQTAAEESKWQFDFQEQRQRFQGIVKEMGGVCPFVSAGGFSSQAAPLTQAGSDNHDLLKSPQESFQYIPDCTINGVEESEDAYTVPVQLKSCLITSENMIGDELSTRGSEAQASNGSLVYDLCTLLSSNYSQPITNHTCLKPMPTGSHFPKESGLSEVVRHPFQPPSTIYYHGFEENDNLEVIWRVWEDLSRNSNRCVSPDKACVHSGTNFNFTVMSYNILAQDLLEANSELYAHCSEGVITWENRLQNIFKELQTWEPDIICLQEVQDNHFQQQIYPALTEMGYDCVYKRRTGNKTDGCAVCYNTKRFTSLSVRLLEFRRHDCELLDRDNVGIILLLQPTTEHGESIKVRPICVANTHLLFNPRRGDVKLAQLAIVLAEIDSIVRQYKVKGHECEIVLCGDFNSLPNMPLYELIVTGKLYYHGLPAWMVSGQEDLSNKPYYRRLYAPLWPSNLGINDNCRYSDGGDPQGKEIGGRLQYNHDFLRQLRYCPAACVRPPDLELIPGVSDNTPTPDETPQPLPPRHFRNTICHGLNLRSVYSHNISGTQHSSVTTLHSHGAAMVDYIFYSAGKRHTGDREDTEKGLKLLGRLALLSEVDLWTLNGLPNEIFPSDHLSLLAKFQIC